MRINLLSRWWPRIIPTNTSYVERLILRHKNNLKFSWEDHNLKILEGSVFTILHESLGMHKLFSKWVPRLLTPDQKQQRVEDSERVKLGKRIFCVGMWQWIMYFGTHMVFCLLTVLRKVKSLTTPITWHYWIDWAQKSRKNVFKCKKKKYCATSPWKRWSNWMN